jgi:hypothetical protein
MLGVPVDLAERRRLKDEVKAPRRAGSLNPYVTFSMA